MVFCFLSNSPTDKDEMQTPWARTHAISADSEIVFLCLQRKRIMLSAVAHVVRLWKQCFDNYTTVEALR